MKVGSIQIRCIPERHSAALIKGASKPQGLLVEIDGLDPGDGSSGRRSPIAVVPVIDISSSMEGEKLQTACRALDALLDELHPDDICGLVAFDKRPCVVLPPDVLTDAHRARAHHAIRALRTGYLTNISGGLLQAFEVARNIPLRRVTVLLLSDGLPSYGTKDEHELELMVREPATRGLVVSAFGYGSGCDDVLLTRIATAGHGRYKFVEDLADVSKEFHAEIGATRIVAADELSVQVWTDSHRVDEVFLGNVLAGQTKSALVDVPGRKGCSLGPATLAAVHCQWIGADGRRENARAPVEIRLVERKSESAPDPRVQKARDFEKVRGVLLAAEARLRNGARQEAANDMIALLRKIEDPEARALVEKLRMQYQRGDLAEGRSARSDLIAEVYNAKSIRVDESE